MQKVPGVAAVRVSLNDGLTILDLKPDNTITLMRLREVIRNNGFVPKDARVIAAGTLRQAANQLTLEVSGSRESLTVTAAQSTLANELRTRAGATAPIVLTGVVDLANPKSLTLNATEAAK